MITAQGLHFSYGRGRLIEGLDFEARPGECVVFTGPNGSGKSTVISLVSGALKPASGSLKVEGSLGLVPQGTALFEDMTVEENLLFFAGLAGADIPSQLPFALDRYRKKKLASLSGGTKKRVSICCALLGQPDNLLFDEPCAGLDVVYRDELTTLIKRLKAEGRSILYVGHEPQEYTGFYDRLIFLGGETPRQFEKESFSGTAGDEYAAALQAAQIYRSLCEECRKEGTNE